MCRQARDIPERCLKAVKPEIARRLGRPIDEMLPAFAENFPLTAQAMRTHWPLPVLAFYEYAFTPHGSLVLEGADRNLFFDLGNVALPTEGADFESYVAMLPPPWKELYRWFWSFTITVDVTPSLYWRNTPVSYASRLRLRDWARLFKGGTAKAKRFERRVRSLELRGWLATDADDTLWLDERRCDHLVYHVRGGAFDDAVVLADPSRKLDQYLAHVVSGGRPADFDFRAGCDGDGTGTRRSDETAARAGLGALLRRYFRFASAA